MCSQTKTRGFNFTSPLALKLAKITVVLIFFCFAECAAGSCLSYGHACWGAHGKRSAFAKDNNMDRPENNWLISALMKTPMRLVDERSFELPPGARNIQQLFPDAQVEVEPLKGQEYKNPPYETWSDKTGEFPDIYSFDRKLPVRLRSSKILDKRSAKQI